jgi:hypothetical protein
MVIVSPGDIGRVTSLNPLAFDTGCYMRYRSVRLGEPNVKSQSFHAGRLPAIHELTRRRLNVTSRPLFSIGG